MNFQEQTRLKMIEKPEASEAWNLTSIDRNLEDSQFKPTPGISLAQQNPETIKPQIEQLLIPSLDSPAPLQNIVALLQTAFLTDGCFIALKQMGRVVPQFVFADTKSLSSQPFPLLLQRLDRIHPLIRTKFLVISDCRDAYYSDVVNDLTAPHWNERSLTSQVASNLPLDWRALMAIQVQSPQGDVLLVLVKHQAYFWTEAEVKTLTSVSDLIAIGLLQVYSQVRSQQLTKIHTLLNQLTTAVRQGRDLSHIYHLTLKGLVAAFQSSRGRLFSFKYANPLHRSLPNAAHPVKAVLESEVSVQTTADTRPANPLWSSSGFDVTESTLMQQLFVEKKTIAIAENQQSDDPSCASRVDLLLVPLENQGTLLGCLLVQHDQPYCWTSEAIASTELVAAHLGTAILQALTLRQVQALVEDRTAQLQRSLEVQTRLYDKVRYQIEQLRGLNQQREEFLSTVSHELLTPLTSMTIAIRMLRQASLSPERQAKYLTILEQQCVQETNLINDLLALQKLESGQAVMQFGLVNAAELVAALVQDFEPIYRDRGLRLVAEIPPDPIHLHTDMSSFHRILHELLTNASKYSEAGTTIRLTLQQESGAFRQMVVVKVCNIGAAITPEEMPRIFDRFSRGAGMTQKAVPGTGLGLALVKTLVDHLGGAIAVSSQPLVDHTAWETSFTITLPQFSESALL
jgi:signal transduction histidine kinase